ncbi:MAG: hypothetical protein ACJAVK_002192 [Akkermansiaceae bacterium]|jgi:hypothetical protein
MPLLEDSGPKDTPNLLSFGKAAHVPRTVGQ